MEDFWGNVISSILGVVTGVVGTVCYNKLKVINEKRKRERVKKTIHPINIFESYRGKSVVPIVSYGDIHAIEIEPLLQNGIFLLKSNINLENRPATKSNRDFVMALLTYTPVKDWSYYAECGYSFKFKIRGSIKGIQLEVKNKDRRKLIDEYVAVEDNFHEKIYPLIGDTSIWVDVEEICFTVFCEDEYIQNKYGGFEIMDCKLEK